MSSFHLKSALQNLDVHIEKLKELRNQLAAMIPPTPEIGTDVFAPPAPVQTPEPKDDLDANHTN